MKIHDLDRRSIYNFHSFSQFKLEFYLGRSWLGNPMTKSWLDMQKIFNQHQYEISRIEADRYFIKGLNPFVGSEKYFKILPGAENLERSGISHSSNQAYLWTTEIFLQSVNMQMIQILTMPSIVKWLYRWVHLILMFLMILYGQTMTKY